MILPGNAALIISAARHIIRLGSRIDNLMAERAAVQSDLVLKMPEVGLPDMKASVKLARDALQKTAGQMPDPFGDDRAALEAELARTQPGARFGDLFDKYFPDKSLLVDPDADYLARLQQAFPGLDWRDPGARVAAFAVGAGTDNREVGYNARVALSVADTLLEFGAENTALFVRDEELRGMAQTVLERLARPEWDQFESWNPLLQTALKAVLNAALDVGESRRSGSAWLAGVLDALVLARESAADPDDFLLGLVQGEGFQTLLAQGLLVAGDRLDDGAASAFKLVAADVLREAVPLVENTANPDFRRFFDEHWGDLLRAGLSAVDRHGDELLAGQKPVVGAVLRATVRQLAATSDAQFLTGESLYRIADAAITVVADNKDRIPGLEDKPWLREFIAAAAGSAHALTLRKLFAEEAAETLVLDAIGVLARHPELILQDRKGLPYTVVTDVLGAVAGAKRLDARVLGEAAIRTALEAVANDPALAAGTFGPAVTAVTRQLAGLAQQGKLATVQAADLAAAAIEAMARNPRVYGTAEKKIAETVIEAVQQTLPNTVLAPWAGRMLVDLARESLLAVARAGGPAAERAPAAQFKALVTDTLAAGLKLADTELGRSVDLNGVPLVVAGLIERALRGDLQKLDPADPLFVAAFTQLAAGAARA